MEVLQRFAFEPSFLLLFSYLKFVAIKNSSNVCKVNVIFLQMRWSFHLTEQSVCNFISVPWVISDFVL